MILQPQCSQLGASAWIAHSKLSNTCGWSPGMVTRNALSYSFPHTSHCAIPGLLSIVRREYRCPMGDDRNSSAPKPFVRTGDGGKGCRRPFYSGRVSRREKGGADGEPNARQRGLEGLSFGSGVHG